jgi:hypothetical protein
MVWTKESMVRLSTQAKLWMCRRLKCQANVEHSLGGNSKLKDVLQDRFIVLRSEITEPAFVVTGV